MSSSVIGHNLKALMDKASVSVTDLSERSGVSTATIDRIRNNRAPNPSTATINALCLALGCPTVDLIGQDAASHVASDIESALMAQQEAYERNIASEQERREEIVTELRTRLDEHKASKEKSMKHLRTATIIALIALVGWAVTGASYYRFHWDVTHPTMGNIQYETLAEFKEALGIID